MKAYRKIKPTKKQTDIVRRALQALRERPYRDVVRIAEPLDPSHLAVAIEHSPTSEASVTRHTCEVKRMDVIGLTYPDGKRLTVMAEIEIGSTGETIFLLGNGGVAVEEDVKDVSTGTMIGVDMGGKDRTMLYRELPPMSKFEFPDLTDAHGSFSFAAALRETVGAAFRDTVGGGRRASGVTHDWREDVIEAKPRPKGEKAAARYQPKQEVGMTAAECNDFLSSLPPVPLAGEEARE